MGAFDKILLITKIAFLQVWWCLTYSLLSIYYITYEVVPDPVNKLRSNESYIPIYYEQTTHNCAYFPVVSTRQLGVLAVNILLAKESCGSLSTSNAMSGARGFIIIIINIKSLAVLLLNYFHAHMCGMALSAVYFKDTLNWQRQWIVLQLQLFMRKPFMWCYSTSSAQHRLISCIILSPL
mgnify:CR=1 FL=1